MWHKPCCCPPLWSTWLTYKKAHMWLWAHVHSCACFAYISAPQNAAMVENKHSLIKKSCGDAPADLISPTQMHTYKCAHTHIHTWTQHDNTKREQHNPRPTNKSAAGEISPAQHPINNSTATGVRGNTKRRMRERRNERERERTRLGKSRTREVMKVKDGWGIQNEKHFA